jgi:hypothetical protein
MRQRVNFGDHFYLRREEDGTYSIETTRGSSARVERKVVESGFMNREQARERALALVSTPKGRRAKFKLVLGGTK